MWQELLRRCLGMLLHGAGAKSGGASMPQHVAFIMDGNRRFANLQHIGKLDGHSMGYSKMVEVIHWCLDLGVQYISVYAFSIDNFQRSHDEVSALMQLAESKYKELAQEEGLPEQEGVEVRILGDLDLAPASVCGAAARLMQATAAIRKKQAVLNICFAYTSTEETVQAVDTLQSAQHAGCIDPGDVTPELLGRCLRTKGCPPVDLLIRTSGETRLSDFLVWQASHAHLTFVDKLWPDFSFVDFLRCILDYLRHAPALQQLRHCSEPGPQQARKVSDPRSTSHPPTPSYPSPPKPFSTSRVLIHLLTSPAAAQQTLFTLLPSFTASAWAATQWALTALLRSVLSIMVLAVAAAAAGAAWVLGIAQAVLVCALQGAQASIAGGPMGLKSKEKRNGWGGGSGSSGRWHVRVMQGANGLLLGHLPQRVQQLLLLSRSPDPIQMHALDSTDTASHAKAAGCFSSAAKDGCEASRINGRAGGHTHQPLLQCRSPRQLKQQQRGSIEGKQLCEGSILGEQQKQLHQGSIEGNQLHQGSKERKELHQGSTEGEQLHQGSIAGQQQQKQLHQGSIKGEQLHQGSIEGEQLHHGIIEGGQLRRRAAVQQAGIVGPGVPLQAGHYHFQHSKQHTTRSKGHLTTENGGLFSWRRGGRQVCAEGAAGAKHLPLHVQWLLQRQERQHEAWLEAHTPLT